MLSIFTVPKPFNGPIDTIQRNAIQSWIRLEPSPEVIIFGDDEGASEVAGEFGIRHVPSIARNDFGTPLLNDLFKKATSSSNNELLCYVNADILLMNDFSLALKQADQFKKFLIVGQRWDIEIAHRIDFDNAKWEEDMRMLIKDRGKLHGLGGMDYFVFSKGLFEDLPPFAIGRTAWDNWLLYKAWAVGAQVIDATEVIIATHQNHDYSHHENGTEGVWKGPEAEMNYELVGETSKFFTLEEAHWRMTKRGMKRPKLTRRRILGQFGIYTNLPELRPYQRSWIKIFMQILVAARFIRNFVRKRMRQQKMKGQE